MNVIYWGLFLIDQFDGSLEKKIENQHITFGFKTEPPEGIPWGETVEVDLIGYGINDTNEGYLVRLAPELERYYSGAEVIHITTSVSKDGKPVNTKDCPFWMLDGPKKIRCRWDKFEV